METVGEVAARCYMATVSKLRRLHREERSTHDRRVARVIGVIQKPVVLGFEDCLYSFEITLCNRVAHQSEGLHTLGECSIGVPENR